MKAINNIYKIFSWLLLSLMLMTACENDGDTMYLSSIEGSDFVVTESNVKLSKETSTAIVLSLAWTKNSFLSTSNPSMGTTATVSYYIQISTDADFKYRSDIYEESANDFSKAYTGAELNTIAKTLGIEPGNETPVYFRIRSVTGANMDGPYSKVETVNITSYLIDMSVGHVLDADKVDTGVTLYSPDTDGIYRGFMGASGWYNYYLLEGDGTLWGNDGVSGTAFLMSSENDSDKRWNFWFPGITGCYYTEVNTNTKQWSALLLPSLTVSGDINAEMTFDRPNVKWTAVFNATKATTLTVKLNTVGKQYDYSTGTDDAAAKDSPVTFAPDGQNIVLASQAGGITVTVPEAGTYTLVVDLSKPGAWTCTAVSGSEEPEPVIQYLYLPGIDDGITGGDWNFNHYMKLYNEDELSYAGVFNVNSKWGYSINIEKDNWDDKYTMAEGGTAYAGSLEFKGQNNIPAPTAGLYLIETSLVQFTYSLTSIGNQVYVLGLHDVWDFNTPLTATATAGVYEGPITINSASPWGFVIHLVNGDWDRKFGGSDGKLYYRGENIKDDASLAPGTYQLKVDIINETYSITQ
ncbi:hypothetical protein GGR21_003972 [Dysgonomonas hofstadii]|uniref:SusE outer membrane protein domain-containing protein n=1 Tax=Dysgonomonas hofstadii TaxID=637886 RepID=A0A840CZA4_9BACT|nr:DUF5114 domain-containing protein [Dysgonomonas hofstadii]MBB4038045.1 hypothetical protein [Dysgonomonas hofstadii]